MNKKPKVSVIVPIYNSARFLKKCLDSISTQSLQDIQIILVNNGSTDSSPEIMNTYSKNDSRFKIITIPRSNAGAARNAGLAHAKGEYLAFIDSDDFYEKDALDSAYHTAKSTNADITIFLSTHTTTPPRPSQALHPVSITASLRQPFPHQTSPIFSLAHSKIAPGTNSSKPILSKVTI